MSRAASRARIGQIPRCQNRAIPLPDGKRPPHERKLLGSPPATACVNLVRVLADLAILLRGGVGPARTAPERRSDVSWLPEGWAHPLWVPLGATSHLRPIRAADVDLDMLAVMG